ncbi:junctional adhesion molecule 3B isoform X1 [Pangasianodon hypophthalmus]|uniref:junctional adhesion molecule 3B isoform X1 n=2 Tax=Pangasianodon hypophthalmus TaxID=310915 RepID=UPI0023079360|nr:junctional adhesion molecule 3B isoform X1 [Pangasianodon hypophthalmus]
MASGRRACVTVLLCSLCCMTFAVILRTIDNDVWVNEFDSTELTCFIESTSTNSPRIEWKKVKNGVPSYVYFQNKISGDLENRALLIEPATLLIPNVSRSDSAMYRCEVAAIDDLKDFDEIRIRLAVRVKPVVPQCSVPSSVTAGHFTELRCKESQGYPLPHYQWFRDNEELPKDPKTSIRFYNSSYVMNAKTGSLKFRAVRKEDAGEYHCQARNDAGYENCAPQLMKVYDSEIEILVLKIAAGVMSFILLTAGLRLARKHICCSRQDQRENDYRVPPRDSGKDDVRADEGHFQHKPSFVV